MNLSLVLIILFLVFAWMSSSASNPTKTYTILCCIAITLSASLKSLKYGTDIGGADTWAYYNIFQDHITKNFSEIWEMFKERYFSGNDDTGADIGYLLLEKFVSIFTRDYHIFSTIASLLFIIPFGSLLNRFCNNITELFFAFIFYVALCHTFLMYGGRQVFALGFGILFFLNYIDFNYKKAFIYLAIGITIHMSLLLVLLPFALSFLSPKLLKRLHIIAFLIFPIIYLFPNQIIMFMGTAVGVEKYANYGTNELIGGGTTFILLMEMLSLFCLIFSKSEWLDDEVFKKLYAMAPCITFFTPLIVSNGSMIRITLYSYIYLTVLIPILLRRNFPQNYKGIIAVLCLALSVLMLKGEYSPYHFFWNVDPQYTW